jgi:hypothetical protein
MRMVPHELAQRWDRRPSCRGRRLRRYRPTVRGDTASDNLSSNSFAIRSSPQVGFAWAMLTISRCNASPDDATG